MRKLYTSSLMLMLALFTGLSAWAQETEWSHVTTPRSWDFTKGSNHKNEITNCDYWNSSLSSGRTTLLKNLENQELPSNTASGVLPGLDGVYFTVAARAGYGISGH